MLRTVGSVIAGYVVMAIAIMVLFAAAYPVLGIDRLFAPGTYQASMGWILLSILLGFAAAAAGGWITARLAPGSSAPRWRAALVLVLGLLTAASVMMTDDPARGGPRPDGAAMADVMAHAQQPVWVALLNPLLGAAGVLAGAGAGKRK
jgi:hypothetical protein